MTPLPPRTLAFLAALAAHAVVAQANPAACTAQSGPTATPVIELYTSEGCNSCPPADRWLSSWKDDPGTVVLAFHVDYWDRLGWKDRFASAAYSQRQARQQSINGAGFSYTPQVVIDGRDRKDWPKVTAAARRSISADCYAICYRDVPVPVLYQTRPRCDRIEQGAIVNLRGPGETDTPDSDRLVSIRLWVRKNRVTSLSRRGLSATLSAVSLAEAGKILDPGDLVAAFAREISRELDPLVAQLGDQLDDCESAIETGSIYKLRTSIAQIRSDAIAFRRFVAPDRDALTSLAEMDFDWLDEPDRLHIKEAADRFARMTEELEAVRERAALLHEQLTDLRSEQVDQRSLVISIVAFIFLPLTFVTGLLGMNVEGIPYAHAPWAFWGVVAFCVLIGAIVLAWFLWRHWLRR